MAANEDHVTIIQELVAYIDTHLDEDLSLPRLAERCGYSPHHFHKLFKEIVGENLKAYIRRLRLERSAYTLKVDDRKIIDMALTSGFTTHEAYSRAFQRRFSMNPFTYKKTYQPLSAGGKNKLPLRHSGKWLADIQLVRRKPLECLFLSRRGPYGGIYDGNDFFAPWRSLVETFPKPDRDLSSRQIIGVCHDDPEITTAEHLRYDFCVDAPSRVAIPKTTRTLLLEGGAYLRGRHEGPRMDLDASYHYLLWVYAAESGLKLRDTAPFERYALKEGELSYVEVFIPLSPT